MDPYLYTPFLDPSTTAMASAAMGQQVQNFNAYNPAAVGMGFDRNTLAYGGLARSGMNPTYGQRVQQGQTARMVAEMNRALYANDSRVHHLGNMVRGYVGEDTYQALTRQLGEGNLGQFLGAAVNNTPLANVLGGSMTSLGFGALAASSMTTRQFSGMQGLSNLKGQQLQFATAAQLANQMNQHFTTASGGLDFSKTHGFNRDDIGTAMAHLAQAGTFDNSKFVQLRRESGRTMAALDENSVRGLKDTLQNTLKLASSLEDLYGDVGMGELLRLGQRITGLKLSSQEAIQQTSKEIGQLRMMAETHGMDPKRLMDVRAGMTGMLSSMGVQGPALGVIGSAMMRGGTQGTMMAQYQASGFGGSFADFAATRTANVGAMLQDPVGRRLVMAREAYNSNAINYTQLQEIQAAARGGTTTRESRREMDRLFFDATGYSFDQRERELQESGGISGAMERMGGPQAAAFLQDVENITQTRSANTLFLDSQARTLRGFYNRNNLSTPQRDAFGANMQAILGGTQLSARHREMFLRRTSDTGVLTSVLGPGSAAAASRAREHMVNGQISQSAVRAGVMTEEQRQKANRLLRNRFSNVRGNLEQEGYSAENIGRIEQAYNSILSVAGESSQDILNRMYATTENNPNMVLSGSEYDATMVATERRMLAEQTHVFNGLRVGNNGLIENLAQGIFGGNMGSTDSIFAKGMMMGMLKDPSQMRMIRLMSLKQFDAADAEGRMRMSSQMLSGLAGGLGINAKSNTRDFIQRLGLKARDFKGVDMDAALSETFFSSDMKLRRQLIDQLDQRGANFIQGRLRLSEGGFFSAPDTMMAMSDNGFIYGISGPAAEEAMTAGTETLIYSGVGERNQKDFYSALDQEYRLGSRTRGNLSARRNNLVQIAKLSDQLANTTNASERNELHTRIKTLARRSLETAGDSSHVSATAEMKRMERVLSTLYGDEGASALLSEVNQKLASDAGILKVSDEEKGTESDIIKAFLGSRITGTMILDGENTFKIELNPEEGTN
jgi:hypothetical protein